MLVITVGNKADVASVTFSPDGSALKIRADGSLDLWGIATGQRRAMKTPPGFAINAGLVFHPSGRWLFSWAKKGGLAAHDLQTGKSVVEPLAANETGVAAVWPVAVTPNGELVLCAWRGRSHHYKNGYCASSWSADGAFGPGFAPVDSYTDTDTHMRYSCGLEPLADNERFVTVDYRFSELPRLAVRSCKTGEPIAATAIDGRDRPTLAVAPVGELIAVAVTGSLFIFTAADLAQAPHKLRNTGRKHFTDIAFHPSGKYLAATSNDETVKLYDTATWEVARTFTWDIGRMRSVAFSVDGTLAAAGGDKGKVVVWDVDV